MDDLAGSAPADLRGTVAVVDLMDGGHHCSYAALIGDALIASGWAPLFVLCPELAIRLVERRPAFEILRFPHHDGREPLRSLRRVRSLRRLFSVLRARKVDRVLLLYIDRWILPLDLIREHLPGFRVLACHHQLYQLDSEARSLPIRLQRACERRAYQRLLDQGLRIVVHTKLQARQLSAYLECDPPRVMPYPLELPMPAPRDQNPRGDRGIPPEARVALCFGGTRLEKGADIAARILALLPRDWHLIVAGAEEDFDAAALEALAGDGARDRLHCFFGFVPDDAVEAFFRAADVVLLPYRMAFAGQSGPLTIAAALGVPVLCSGNRQLRDLVDRYKLGASFDGLDPRDGARQLVRLADQAPESCQREFMQDHGSKALARALDEALNWA